MLVSRGLRSWEGVSTPARENEVKTSLMMLPPSPPPPPKKISSPVYPGTFCGIFRSSTRTIDNLILKNYLFPLRKCLLLRPHSKLSEIDIPMGKDRSLVVLGWATLRDRRTRRWQLERNNWRVGTCERRWSFGCMAPMVQKALKVRTSIGD